METGLRWLLLVAVLKGVQCQSLEESGGGLVKPGGSLTLTCTVSGLSLSSNEINWVLQAPGEGLEYITTIGSSVAHTTRAGQKADPPSPETPT
uniref:Ig-like domain-containing protein n=1 Tax=Oryctolagus cuniculus TaxID=9986 RepID=A0A5F9CUT4_RABIT